jgi:PAS domain S-box-containing protein
MKHAKRVKLARALLGAQKDILRTWRSTLEAHSKLHSRKGSRTKVLLSAEMRRFLDDFLRVLEARERRQCEHSLGRMARLLFQVELPHTILAQMQIDLKRIMIREVIRRFDGRTSDIRDMCNLIESEIDRNRIFLADEFENLALATLASSERNYRELIEDMEDLVFRLNSEGRIIFANSACVRFFETPVESTIGKNITEYLEPSGKVDFSRALESVLSRRRKAELLCEIHGERGGKSILHFRMYPLREGGGSVSGVRGIARDMSRTKSLESELGRANALLQRTNLLLASKAKELETSQRILEGMSERLEPESIIRSLATPLEEIVSFTSLTLFILGSTRNTIIMRGNRSWCREDRNLLFKEVSGELRKTRMVSEEALFRQPEEHLFAENAFRQGEPGGGASLCFPLIAEDAVIGALHVRDRERHAFPEEEKSFLKNVTSLISLGLSRLFSMREYQKRMEEVTKMKSDFSSLVSHELRTPLTSLKNVIDLLLSGRTGELESKQSHLISLAKKDTERLCELITNILDISKLESGSTVLHRREIEVRESLESAVLKVRGMAQEKEIGLIMRVSRTLPRLYADPERLEQILENLLSNAIRFSPGGAKVWVSVHLIANVSKRLPHGRKLPPGWRASTVLHNGKENGGSSGGLPAAEPMMEISVRDWGSGISEERLDAIFDKYAQADPVMTRAASGIGLGLTITKYLTIAHEGVIWVESREGEGSVFRCLFPVSRGEAFHRDFVPAD